MDSLAPFDSRQGVAGPFSKWPLNGRTILNYNTYRDFPVKKRRGRRLGYSLVTDAMLESRLAARFDISCPAGGGLRTDAPCDIAA